MNEGAFTPAARVGPKKLALILPDDVRALKRRRADRAKLRAKLDRA